MLVLLKYINKPMLHLIYRLNVIALLCADLYQCSRAKFSNYKDNVDLHVQSEVCNFLL